MSQYKAFISYRHMPDDIAMAEKLHRKIESFRVPSGIKGAENHKIGRVFRDKDELSVSGSLDNRLQDALDNSEYLLVICSKDTRGSAWVGKEISYFLSHHDREHVLAVLISGTPEEAFPDELTCEYDENGNVIGHVEPLAANFSEVPSHGRTSHMNTEYLRIFSALLGCSYDALYKREQRRKKKNAIITGAGVAAIAVSFITMLLIKNAQIKEQLMISIANEQRAIAGEQLAAENEMKAIENETKTLITLGNTQLDGGDRIAAIETALNAITSEDGKRKWTAGAEKLLSTALYVYRPNKRSPDCSASQDTPIVNIVISDSGKYIATTDDYDTLRVFDAENGSLLWSITEQFLSYPRALYFNEDAESLTVSTVSGISSYNCHTGAKFYDFICDGFSYTVNSVSPKSEMAILKTSPNTLEPDVLQIVDIPNNKTLWTFDNPTPEGDDIRYLLQESIISDDCRYVAVKYTTFDNSIDENKQSKYYIIDTESGEWTFVCEGPYSVEMHNVFCFSSDDDLIICHGEKGDGLEISLYAADNNFKERFSLSIDPSTSSAVFGSTIYNIDCTKDYFNIFMIDCVDSISLSDGKYLGRTNIPGSFVYQKANPENNVYFLISSDGVMHGLFAEGGLAIKVPALTNTDFPVSAAAGTEKLRTIAYVKSDDKTQFAIFRMRGDERGTEYTLGESIKNPMYVSPDTNTIYYIDRQDSYSYGLGIVHPHDDYKLDDLTIESNDYLPSPYFATTTVSDKGYIAIDDYIIDVNNATAEVFASKDILSNDADVKSGITAENDLLSMAVYQKWVSKVSDEKDSIKLYRRINTEEIEVIECPYTGIVALSGIIEGYVSGDTKEAAIFKNGTCMFAFFDENTHCFKGYALCDKSGEWSFLDLPSDRNNYAAVAISNDDKHIAFYTEDSLKIADAATGEITFNAHVGRIFESVSALLFSPDNSKLFEMMEYGVVNIYDTASGELVNSINYHDQEFAFGSHPDIRLYPLNEANKYALISYNNTYTEPLCSLIDMTTNEEYLRRTGIRSYDAATDSFICTKSDSDTITVYKRLTTEELIELGRQQIAK